MNGGLCWGCKLQGEMGDGYFGDFRGQKEISHITRTAAEIRHVWGIK